MRKNPIATGVVHDIPTDLEDSLRADGVVGGHHSTCAQRMDLLDRDGQERNNAIQADRTGQRGPQERKTSTLLLAGLPAPEMIRACVVSKK